MLIEILLFIFFIVLLAATYWYATIPANLPPGPFNLPFIGHSFGQVETELYLKLDKWSKKYGPIFSFYIGNQLIITITDYEIAKEAFVKQADTYIGKFRSWIVQKLNFDHGLLMNNGQEWKEQRRFALSTLRDFGFGKPILENGIVEELQYVCSEIRNLNGNPYDFQYLLNNAVSNVICQLVFGRRFSYDDPEFQKVLKAVIVQAQGSVTNGFVLKEWMMLIPQVKARYIYASRQIMNVVKFVDKFIKSERANFDIQQDPENYIQSYLKAQNENSGEKFTDLQLQMSVHALFSAGTDTTSNTLQWGLLLCTRYPEIQKKIQAELDSIVGPSTDGNVPMLKHRKDLIYCDAVLLEIQRFATLVPTSHRYMSEDSTLMSYNIPKDALVLRNNWTIHRDPKHFPDPYTFNPDRFIDQDGKVQRPETLIPFGIGKRVCLGESLAKMELFLFFTYLMHKFSYTFPPNEPVPSLEHSGGITLKPMRHKLIATERLGKE